MRFDFDVVVIGAGSGGVRLSRLLATAGKRVALVEKDRIGGTCVIRGCVPKKLLAYAAGYRADAKDAAGFGLVYDERLFSWVELRTRIQREVSRLSEVYRESLQRSGVILIEGSGQIDGEHDIVVGSCRMSAERIVISTGSIPNIPDVPGAQHSLNSNDVFQLDEIPKRLGIVGGGYIAVEFASILTGLGAAVELICRGNRVLRGFDDDLRNSLTDEITRQGISLLANRQVRRLRREGQEVVATLDDTGERRYDALLFATGRTPNVKGLGLEKLGIALTQSGAISVDARFASSVPSIFAIGDANGRMQLTPVATREAEILAARVIGLETGQTLDYEVVPSAVFTRPEIATVGLSEHAARLKYGKLDIYRTRFNSMRHTLSERDEKTLMKLIVDRSSQKVVGAHMIGRDASEIMQGIAIAISMGARKEDFDRTLGIHPTSAEEFVTLRVPMSD